MDTSFRWYAAGENGGENGGSGCVVELRIRKSLGVAFVSFGAALATVSR